MFSFFGVVAEGDECNVVVYLWLMYLISLCSCRVSDNVNSVCVYFVFELFD